MGELLSSYQCESRLSEIAAIYQHPLSSVSDLSKQAPRLRMETISRRETVCDGNHLHREWTHPIRESSCACFVTKAVGPPDSGKPNVRWDGKGIVKQYARLMRHCTWETSQRTDRYLLPLLNHSFTLAFVSSDRVREFRFQSPRSLQPTKSGQIRVG